MGADCCMTHGISPLDNVPRTEKKKPGLLRNVSGKAKTCAWSQSWCAEESGGCGVSHHGGL